jgi:hypothetical protein
MNGIFIVCYQKNMILECGSVTAQNTMLSHDKNFSQIWNTACLEVDG